MESLHSNVVTPTESGQAPDFKNNLFMKRLLYVLFMICALKGNAQLTDSLAILHPEYLPTLKIGSQAPEIVARDTTGTEYKLSAYKGQYVVLDFWATWCGDCRREVPGLKALYANEEYRKIKGTPVQWLSFSFDDKEEQWKNFLRSEQFPWPQISNLKRTRQDPTFQAYKLNWIPAFLVINPEGEIAGMAITANGLQAELERLAKEERVPKCPFDEYELVWHDEFNGTALSADWTHEVKPKFWVNRELQNYVAINTPSGKKVTEVSDGTLKLTALKEDGEVYSGRVYAMRSSGWQYGYMEASIKLPVGKGTWPAFWMMPTRGFRWPADGEIDIMEEVGYNPNYVSSSLHATGHVHTNNTQVTHEMLQEGAEGGFHLYAIKWTPQNITTYVDGRVQLSYDNPGTGKVDWPYDAPFYLILNLAWGGAWGGMHGVDESRLPATMEIDYVRVYQKK